MSLIRNQTLSIILVLSLVIGGIPLFFAATDNAEAAGPEYPIQDKPTNRFSLTDSHGYLNVEVKLFGGDEGSKPIQGYTILLKWDQCRKDLNPFSGFWRTIRTPYSETITTDAKGEASWTFNLPNGVWTENAWLYGAGEGWNNPSYFLGNMASLQRDITIWVQPSGETIHQIARADTLGIIQDWYQMTDTQHEYTGAEMSYLDIRSSRQYAGGTKVSISWVNSNPGPTLVMKSEIGTSSSGQLSDARLANHFYKETLFINDLDGGETRYISVPDVDVYDGVYFNVYRGVSGTTYGNYRTTLYAVDSSGENLTVCTLAPNAPQYAPSVLTHYNLPPGRYDFVIEATQLTLPEQTYTGYVNPILYTGSSIDFILTDLNDADKTIALDVFSDDSSSVTIDLSGRWGEWQTSGYSSTLTDQDLVPVAAKINGVYPLVISNPRWDRTPIADTTNGLKFDVYNIRDGQTTATINLALTTDNDTQVWATTVGSRIYPAWTNASQFTTVHLTDVFMPAEPRREYQLRITSGGAITEIPVVFYPAEMDPDVIYEPKEDLDKIIKDYGTVNAAALKAYHDWAVSMQPRIEVIKADVQNYTKLFEQRLAVDNLALSDAAATRGLELIAALKEICKGDGSATSIGELTSHAQGIWSSYQAALLYREAAISFEAGQTAFGNSTALDAWYQDLVSKRITVGLQDQKQGDDPSSVAVWVGVAVALVVGGLVMYLSWSYIVPTVNKILPKGRSKRMRTIRAITPLAITIVLAVIIALVAFLATWNIALSIEAALR